MSNTSEKQSRFWVWITVCVLLLVVLCLILSLQMKSAREYVVSQAIVTNVQEDNTYHRYFPNSRNIVIQATPSVVSLKCQKAVASRPIEAFGGVENIPKRGDKITLYVDVNSCNNMGYFQAKLEDTPVSQKYNLVSTILYATVTLLASTAALLGLLYKSSKRFHDYCHKYKWMTIVAYFIILGVGVCIGLLYVLAYAGV